MAALADGDANAAQMTGSEGTTMADQPNTVPDQHCPFLPCFYKVTDLWPRTTDVDGWTKVADASGEYKDSGRVWVCEGHAKLLSDVTGWAVMGLAADRARPVAGG
ncbi:MAG: hypothetical protein M3Y33_09175 [Actinomycetota bacterium]|nr:hypothetical protein [Actinomycetota bacterium]